MLRVNATYPYYVGCSKTNYGTRLQIHFYFLYLFQLKRKSSYKHLNLSINTRGQPLPFKHCGG